MASINHLEMCNQLKALPEIEIKKTCFGLFTQAVYKPSQSLIKVNQNEYSVEIGGQLEKLLKGNEAEIVEQRNKGKKFRKSDMGNMRLDTCISKDRQFVGAQLLRFIDFSYKPVTDMVVYEGKTAEAFAELFD